MLIELRLKRFILALLFAASYVWTIHAQTPDSVVLHVTVTNEKGVLSRGLTMENFSVTTDKQVQKVLSLNDRDVPASVGILIDDSGSQYISNSKFAQNLRDQFGQVLERFLKVSHAENEYFVVTFNSKVQLAQDWTSDARAVVGKLDSLTFKKQTSMYDALKFGVEKVKTGRNSKHVLILVSDGMDNNSKLGFKETRDLMKASDVLLYCVGINDDMSDASFTPVPYVNGPKILNELSANSGGRSLFMTVASAPQAFKEVFELIALELRTQYQLVIAPDHAAGKTKWRKLKINAQRGSEHLLARTRQWYFK